MIDVAETNGRHTKAIAAYANTLTRTFNIEPLDTCRPRQFARVSFALDRRNER